MTQILDSSMLKYYLEPIISSCNLWKDKNLFVFMIANPVSGGFTRKKIAKKNKSILESASNVAKETSVVVKSVEFTLFETEYAGHGDEFVNTIFDFYNLELTADFENYRDISHYTKDINDYLVECFADGTGIVTVAEQLTTNKAEVSAKADLTYLKYKAHIDTYCKIE